MKRKELLPLKDTIGTVDNADFKLQMKLFRNFHKAKPDVEIASNLQESLLKNRKEFQSKMDVLNIKHAKKDEEGKPIIKNSFYQFVDRDKWDSERQVLTEEYRRWQNVDNGLDEEYEKVMNEEVNIVFLKLTADEVKQLNGGQLVAFKHMLPKKLKTSDLNENVKAADLIAISDVVEITEEKEKKQVK